MQQQSGTSASRDPELVALVKRKAALSRTLTLVMFVVYFGFMGLLAYEQRQSTDIGAPGVLSSHIGAATAGIPLGIGLIIFTWALTGIYVRWANGAYDEVVARLKSK